ncbi:MAG TPA: hypothetical protein PLL54_04595 [Dermatophilaceae bacterium]|nr:hypothetical protein [Dermatophilaceae bacterium]
MTTLLRILARRLAPKVALLCALVAAAGAATLPSYASTYQTDAARAAAVELAARNGAALVLYGRLEPPGHAAAMFVWEMGAFITIGVAVVAVLLAAGLTRGLDTDGTVELARSAGVTPRAMVLTASLLLVVTALTVGASSAAGLLWPSGCRRRHPRGHARLGRRRRHDLPPRRRPHCSRGPARRDCRRDPRRRADGGGDGFPRPRSL